MSGGVIGIQDTELTKALVILDYFCPGFVTV